MYVIVLPASAVASDFGETVSPYVVQSGLELTVTQAGLEFYIPLFYF